jgi:hypothetical protein
MIAKLSVNFLFFSLSPSLKMRYIFPLSAQEGGSRIVIAKEGLCFVLFCLSSPRNPALEGGEVRHFIIREFLTKQIGNMGRNSWVNLHLCYILCIFSVFSKLNLNAPNHSILQSNQPKYNHRKPKHPALSSPVLHP